MNEQLVETTVYSLSAVAPAQPERRTSERYISLLRVGALTINGQRELCLIRNISAGGMMIRPFRPIPRGTRVSIELKHGESVTGFVQWSDKTLVGVTFDSSVDVLSLLTTSASGPQPRMPRIELACSAWVRHDGDVHRTRTVNISQGGICVQTAAEIPVAVNVTVSIPGLAPAAGVVKWKDGDLYGIGFNRVLAIGEIMTFLRAQQDVGLQRKAS